MTDWLVGALAAAVAAALMEPWARLLHGRVWHGPLLGIHRSHHRRRRGRFEANDWLSTAHAPIAAGLVVAGCQLVPGAVGAAMIGAGVGMTLFGVAYVLVHDGLVHGRLPVRFLGRVGALRRVRDAHLVHHARGGPPYGLFLGPRELERGHAITSRARRTPQRAAADGPSARSASR